MALVICSECSNKISDNAPTCIHCGNPMKKPQIQGRVVFRANVSNMAMMTYWRIFANGKEVAKIRQGESWEMMIDEGTVFSLKWSGSIGIKGIREVIAYANEINCFSIDVRYGGMSWAMSKTCLICGREIANDCYRCPYCGYVMATQQRKRTLPNSMVNNMPTQSPSNIDKQFLYKALALVGIIIFVIFLFSLGSGGGSGDSAGAIAAAKMTVRDSLKSPSTAKFSSVSASMNSDDSYTVTGKVDAQNSFGATVRNSFYVKLKKGGSGWNIQSKSIY